MSSTVFSPCRTWRYTLARNLDCHMGTDKGCVLFVCLNPSTADETVNDPTVRRCMGFGERWGFERLVVCNLFGLRSTDPGLVYDHHDPVGPDNDYWLSTEAVRADLVVAAWGVHGAHLGRGGRVAARLSAAGEMHVLGLTRAGHPKHPLYLKGDLVPVPWRG